MVAENQSKIIVLVTTYNRPQLLDSRALTSISNQKGTFDEIILIDNSDSESTRKKNEKLFLDRFPHGVYQVNNSHPSAAGTWNQGLHWIEENHPGAWGAIIDDDDEWLDNHLEVCEAAMDGNDAVISGIRTFMDGELIDDRIPSSLSIGDFFAKNPGWQGSNTFARVSKLLEAGGFDEELLCTHDRDLAIRCLSLPEFRFTLTGEVTMLYHLEKQRDSLTMTKGRGKHTGLLQFHRKHKSQMSADCEEKFIERAANLFGIDTSLFALNDTSDDYPGFPRPPVPRESGAGLTLRKSIHSLRKRWWKLRTKRGMTRLLGRQFIRTREKIEIDLTYACNLRCHDCNRSCRQAPENSELSLERIVDFIDDSLNRKIEWKRIRLLGGEPTLHSQFEDVLYEFARYKAAYPKCRMEVVSNGHGRNVQRKLLQIPPFFHIENTMKVSDIQPFFYSFNLAPKDDTRHRHTDFTNGCSNIVECGIGLTPTGYYPCAIAGGIDRVAGWKLGRTSIPDEEDDMLDLLEKFCGQCGRFESRKFTTPELMPVYTPGLISQSWESLYDEWRANA
jgi:glycosyltransferase involved in cell wall biosynthesis